MNGALRYAAALIAGLLLGAGCSTTPQTRAPGVDALPAIAGRLALNVAATGTGPARALHAVFTLRGDGERGQLEVSSVIGVRLAQARWSPAGAWLRSADDERSYRDLESLARDALGEPVPLQALPDWLHGRPWPGAPSSPAADGFMQLGWQVNLARLDEGFVAMERAGPPAATLRVRLDDG